jgi:pimeloyl-ACP methyl ester carboxylesterase
MAADTPESTPDPVSVDVVSTSDGRRVSYAEYGDPTGTPVLFFHGTPGSHELGRLFAAAARRRGVRLLAPARPGYARSSPWPSRTLADTDAFVVPVLDDAGVDTAGVVGFSGGGPHALALGATRPDRIDRIDVVAGVPPPHADGRKPAVQRLLGTLATTTPRLLGRVLGFQAWCAARLPPRFVAAQYTNDPGGLSDAVLDCVRRDFHTALDRHRRGVVTELAMFDRDWNVSPEAVASPVRLWHGDHDTNVPIAGARRLCDRLTDAELTVFADADHLTTLLRCRSPVLDRYGDG